MLSEYVAALKKLAGVYLFGTVIDQALWDKNVYGVKLSSVKACNLHTDAHIHTSTLAFGGWKRIVI